MGSYEKCTVSNLSQPLFILSQLDKTQFLNLPAPVEGERDWFLSAQVEKLHSNLKN